MPSRLKNRNRGRAAEQSEHQELENAIKNLRDALNKNLSDEEILDVLLESNMDVNAAFEWLLSQDVFQQVKSKRERRKEIKEMQASQAWIKNDETIQSSRDGSGSSSVREGCSQSDSIDPCKVAYERDSGSAAPILHPSSTSYASGRVSNEQPSQDSVDKTHQSVGKGTDFSLPLQRTSGSQPNRDRANLSHLSMADIVKIGTSIDKSLHIASEAPHLPGVTVNPDALQLDSKPFPETMAPRPEIDEGLESSHGTNTLGNAAAQGGSIDEQPVPEQMGATDVSSLLDSFSIPNQDAMYDIAHSSMPTQSYESQLARKIDCMATLPKDLTSDTSKAGTSLQPPSLGKSVAVASLIEDEHSDVIPYHLQNSSADCLNLPFGFYVPGDNSPVALKTFPLAPESGAPAHLSSGNKVLRIGSIDWRNRTSLPRELESQTRVSAVEEASTLQASNVGYDELPVAARTPTPPRALDLNAFPLFQSSDTPTFPGARLGARSGFHRPSPSYPSSGFGDWSMLPAHNLVESHLAMRPDNRYFSPMATPVRQYRDLQEQFRGFSSVRSFHPSPPFVSNCRGFASSSSLPQNVIQNVPALSPSQDFLFPQHMRSDDLAFVLGKRLPTGWNAMLGSGTTTTSNAPTTFDRSWPRPNQSRADRQLNLPPPSPLQGHRPFGRPTSNRPQSEGGQWDPVNGFFGSGPSSTQGGPFNLPDSPWNF